MTDLVFYLVVFLVVGVFFLFIHLLIGKFIRPYRPDAEKMTIYECGEPTVGSAWIQFDLRYYVVALLFVVFDVEVAFFFPWAVVFGKANELSRDLPEKDRAALTQRLVPADLNLAALHAPRPEPPGGEEGKGTEPKKAAPAGEGKKKGGATGKGGGKKDGKKDAAGARGAPGKGGPIAKGGPPPGGGPMMPMPPPQTAVAPPAPI